MMSWLNSVPYHPTCITNLPNKRACVHTMRRACWEIEIQTHLCPHASVMHLGLDTHCDWTETHSSTRCACDRPGLGRWRWGIGEAGESRETHSTAEQSTLGIPQQSAGTLQPRKAKDPVFWGDGRANHQMWLNRRGLNRSSTVDPTGAAAQDCFHHRFVSQLLYRFVTLFRI